MTVIMGTLILFRETNHSPNSPEDYIIPPDGNERKKKEPRFIVPLRSVPTAPKCLQQPKRGRKVFVCKIAITTLIAGVLLFSH